MYVEVYFISFISSVYCGWQTLKVICILQMYLLKRCMHREELVMICVGAQLNNLFYITSMDKIVKEVRRMII